MNRKEFLEAVFLRFLISIICAGFPLWIAVMEKIELNNARLLLYLANAFVQGVTFTMAVQHLRWQYVRAQKRNAAKTTQH